MSSLTGSASSSFTAGSYTTPDGKGFQVAVVLPKGTNYPLKSKHIRIDNKTASTANESTGSSNINEDALLAAANKWLIGHAEGGLDDSVYIGLKGENIEI
jgi:hypothetical protein